MELLNEYRRRFMSEVRIIVMYKEFSRTEVNHALINELVDFDKEHLSDINNVDEFDYTLDYSKRVEERINMLFNFDFDNHSRWNSERALLNEFCEYISNIPESVNEYFDMVLNINKEDMILKYLEMYGILIVEKKKNLFRMGDVKFISRFNTVVRYGKRSYGESVLNTFYSNAEELGIDQNGRELAANYVGDIFSSDGDDITFKRLDLNGKFIVNLANRLQDMLKDNHYDISYDKCFNYLKIIFISIRNNCRSTYFYETLDAKSLIDNRRFFYIYYTANSKNFKISKEDTIMANKLDEYDEVNGKGLAF